MGVHVFVAEKCFLKCSYNLFHRWRCELARVAKYPPLELMQGFYRYAIPKLEDNLINKDGVYSTIMLKALPISWNLFIDLPLTPLLMLGEYNDDNQYLTFQESNLVAIELQQYIGKMSDPGDGKCKYDMNEITEIILKALKEAADLKKEFCFS